MTPHDVVIGAVFAGAIAWIAWRSRALTPGGAVAAFVVGTLTYATGTIAFTLVLLAFFVPSVVLSRFGRARKRGLVDVGKHGARDAMQVLANGGVATVCAVGWVVTHDVRWAVAFAGAYAAATADTWATEIGTLARRAPRSILTLRPVATGMSGGITLPGTLAEIAGAVGLAAVAAVTIRVFLLERYAPLHTVDLNALRAALALTPFEHWHGGLRSAVGVAVAGLLGATLDSVLGATGQELRRCDVCDRACETDPHACGNPTRLVRGVRGFSNDIVNLLATAAGAAVAFILA